MTAETEVLYSAIGRRISELRKRKGLSQANLASSLSRKRTQAWVSTVESGRRNLNANDLFEIATILETTVGELFDTLSRSPGSPPRPLNEFLKEFNARLPIEMPVYLQRDLGEPDAEPIDFQYASSVPGGTVFNKDHPLAQYGNLIVMVVERYYSSPSLDPTDLLTYSGVLIPHTDPDVRVADRVLVKLDEPYAGMSVHPCLIRASGEAETTLAGHPTTVFTQGTYKILGVVVVRRTLYSSSVIRGWMQRQYGITKDERLVQ